MLASTHSDVLGRHVTLHVNAASPLAQVSTNSLELLPQTLHWNRSNRGAEGCSVMRPFSCETRAVSEACDRREAPFSPESTPKKGERGPAAETALTRASRHIVIRAQRASASLAA